MKHRFLIRIWLSSAVTLGLAAYATAAIVGPLDLKSLTSGAGLVAVGQVVDIRDVGPGTIQTPSGEVEARSMTATLRVERVFKGTAGALVEFDFLLPELSSQWWYAPIGLKQFGVFFLRESEGRYRVLDPYHPYIVAVPGAAVTSGNVFEDVVGELAAAVSSPRSSVEVQREAVYALGPTPGAIATGALLEAARRSDPVVRFDSMAELLQRNDLTYLTEAASLLLHPTANDPTLIDNLAVGIGAGIRSPAAVQVLSDLMAAPAVETRRAAARALARTGGNTSVLPLARALYDGDQQVQYWAVIGLARVTGQNPWYSSLGEFRENGDKYLNHWREWAESNVPKSAAQGSVEP